jgi:hypothetical protein
MIYSQPLALAAEAEAEAAAVAAAVAAAAVAVAAVQLPLALPQSKKNAKLEPHALLNKKRLGKSGICKQLLPQQKKNSKIGVVLKAPNGHQIMLLELISGKHVKNMINAMVIKEVTMCKSWFVMCSWAKMWPMIV